MKVLLCGDSFATDWTTQYPEVCGWPNLLANQYNITNCAEAGVSEYKILKQVQTPVLENYDAIIIVHTSVSRVHIEQHPIHKSGLHKNCDLIYNDLANTKSKNKVITTGIDYFKYIFDETYYRDLYEMFLGRIVNATLRHNTLHVTFFDNPVHYPFGCIKLKSIHDTQPGFANHLSDLGNQQIFERIDQWLKSVY